MTTPMLTPLGLISNGPLIKRAFKEAIPHQYDRELVQNSIESGATQIKIQPDWLYLDFCQNANCLNNTYRYLLSDNGKGMNKSELDLFFSNISSSGHDLQNSGNFGVGAKITMLPWNDCGFIVMSWTKNTPNGNMICIVKDPVTHNYCRTEDGINETGHRIKPDYLQSYKNKYIGKNKTGTVVIALGNNLEEDTYFGPKYDLTDEIKQDAHIRFLNTRYFNVSENVNIKVVVFSHTDRAKWPISDNRDNKVYNYYSVNGAAPQLNKISSYSGVTNLSDAQVHWWITDPNKMEKITSFPKSAFVGVNFNKEIYNFSLGKQARHKFTQFGILFEEAKKRLVFIVEPDTQGKTEYYSNTTRSQILCNETDDMQLPWHRWGSEFAQNMPQEVKDLCAKYGQETNSETKTIKERLKDFMLRLRPLFVTGNETSSDSALNSAFLGLNGSGKGEATAQQNQAVSRKNGEMGTQPAKKVSPRVEPPTPIWVASSEFSDEGLAAEFVPSVNTLKINKDFFLFNEVTEFWIKKYPDVPEIENKIKNIIKDIYQLKLISVTMQVYHLASKPAWTYSWREMITPQALTASILGLVIEHNCIQQRLNGLKVRKNS